MVNLKIKASNLIDAHRILTAAQQALHDARRIVALAEAAYVSEVRDDNRAHSVLCEGYLIQLRDDYFDMKQGEQVEVVAVKVIG